MPQWKQIPMFPSYSVSDDGQVRNDRFGRLLVPSRNTGGYLYVQFYDHGKHRTKYVHLLVAEAFLTKPDDAEQVDHINGDKTDNSSCNLRWVTVSQNRLAYGNKERAEARKRPVCAIHHDGTRLDFPSRQDAAKHFMCSDTKIKYGVTYKRGSKKGWTFFQVGRHFR